MANNPSSNPPVEIWEHMITQNGDSLRRLAEKQPVMVVFLRHFGCSFCREAIDDVARKRKKLETQGIRIVMVHMAPERETAEKFFKKYKISPIDFVSDPDCRFYRAFGLGKGSPKQLFGLMNWIRGFQAGVLEGHGFDYQGVEIGDGFQMPGVFVLHRDEVKKSFIHQFSHDRPDYEEICKL